MLAGLALLTRTNASRGMIWAGVATVAIAAFIKLYPAIVLLGAVVAWRGARRTAMAVGLAVLGAWAALNFDEIALILQKTTRGFEPAYGRMIAGSRTYVEILAPQSPSATDGQTLRNLMLASLAGGIGAFSLAALGGWRWRRRMANALSDDRSRACFWSGALIYSGTFLLGSNWSYRLVFLLLCVPALWRATQAAGLQTGGCSIPGGCKSCGPPAKKSSPPITPYPLLLRYPPERHCAVALTSLPCVRARSSFSCCWGSLPSRRNPTALRRAKRRQ